MVAQNLTRGVEAMRGSSGNGAGGGAGAGGPAAEPVGARAAGSAVLRGAVPAAPAARNITASLGGEPVTDAGSGASGARVTSLGGGGAVDPAGPKPGYTPTGARIGRNDPCWCGSGAKYKKCHGR